jgi:hypothetical protein
VDRLRPRPRGVALATVRYITIDYRRHELGIDVVGPREIMEPSEWSNPTYEFPGGHSVDFGVECVTTEGDVWSVAWIPPGRVEGLAVDRGDLVSRPGDVANWDVGGRAPWNGSVGQRIVEVQPEFEPWDGEVRGAWWCPSMRVRLPSVPVRFMLAEGRSDGSMAPSANNLVVRYEQA